MDEEIKMNIENPIPVEDKRSANPSYYLDRMSLTILMLMKLVEALSKLCLAVFCAFMLNSFVAALNKILKNGSVSGKAMIAQILKMLRFPMENIRQAVAVVPSNLTISPKLPLYLFAKGIQRDEDGLFDLDEFNSRLSEAIGEYDKIVEEYK